MNKFDNGLSLVSGIVNRVSSCHKIFVFVRLCDVGTPACWAMAKNCNHWSSSLLNSVGQPFVPLVGEKETTVSWDSHVLMDYLIK